MSDIESIGKRARELRLSMNLSQEEVAEACGMTAKALGSFEKSGKIRLENFLRVLDALGRGEETDSLLTRHPLTPSEIDRINAAAAENGATRLRAFRPSDRRMSAARKNLPHGTGHTSL